MLTIAGSSILRTVAAQGLPHTSLAFPPNPPAEDDWSSLLAGAAEQRISGHLVTAIANGELDVDDTQRDQAVRLHVNAMAHVLRLDRRLTEVHVIFSDAGIEHRVLKGAALAYLDYPDPALRAYGDIDMLVRAPQLEAAVEVLKGIGYHRKTPQLRPGFDRRFAKTVELATSNGYEVDLHRTLVLEPFGYRIALDELFSTPESFTAGGVTVEALPSHQRLVHACYHAVLGSPQARLVPLRDIAQLAVVQEADTDAVVAVAERWACRDVVARGVRLCWEAFQVQRTTDLSRWAANHEPDAWERRALAAYLGGGRRQSGRSIAALRAIPGIRPKAAYLRALVWPEAAYLRGRDASLKGWWRRGIRGVLTGRRP